MLRSPNTLCDSGKEIVDAEQCRSAAISLDLDTEDLTENQSGYPGGCYLLSGLNEAFVFFNKHSGMAESSSRPICLKGKAHSYYW